MTLRKRQLTNTKIGSQKTIKRRLLLRTKKQTGGRRSLINWFNNKILRRKSVNLEKVPPSPTLSQILSNKLELPESPKAPPIPPRPTQAPQSPVKPYASSPAPPIPPRPTQAVPSLIESNTATSPPPRPPKTNLASLSQLETSPKPLFNNQNDSSSASPSPSSNPTYAVKSSNNTITKLSQLKTSNLIYTQQVKKFILLFEDKIKEHDSIVYTERGANNNETYKVGPEMLAPYLRKNGLTSTTNSIWQELFIKHRYLLYLDQYCAFIDFMRRIKNKPREQVNLQTFIESHYFELPIAKDLNASGNNQLTLAITSQMYAKAVYDKLATTISASGQPKMDSINNFMFLFAHGGLGNISRVNMLTVPDNVVIAFITPFNKILTSTSEQITRKISLLNNLISSFAGNDGTNEFYKTPACYFRDVPFMSNTVYYYPGQHVANCLFSYNLKVEDEAKYMGLYQTTQNAENFTNMRDWVFALDNTDNHYRTSLQDIFTTPEKLELIRNKVLFISCCRGSDSYIDDITTEFLYRYESIITFYNMSVCNSPLPSISQEMQRQVARTNISMSYKDNDKKTVFKPSAKNSHDYKLFYDSVLSYKFAIGYTRNAKKQRRSVNTVGAKFLREINSQPDNEKLQHIKNELATCTQEKTSIPDLLIKLTDVLQINLPNGKTWDDILTTHFDFNYIRRYLNRIIESDNRDEYFTQFITLLLTKLQSDTILQHLIDVSYNITKGDKSVNVCQQVLHRLFSNPEIQNNLQLGNIYNIYLNLVKHKNINNNESEKHDIIRTTNNLACLMAVLSEQNKNIQPPPKTDLGFQILFITNVLNILSVRYTVYCFDFLKVQTTNKQYLFDLDMILPSDVVQKIVSETQHISEKIKKLFKQQQFHKLFYVSIISDNNLSNSIKNLLVEQHKFYTLETFNSLIYMFFNKKGSTNNLNIVYEYITDFINQINSDTLLSINLSDYVLPSDFVDTIVNETSYISENIKALFKQQRFQKLFYISIISDNNLSNAIKNILVKQNKFYTPEILFVLVYMWATKNSNIKSYNSNLNIVYEYITDFINQINSGSLPNINLSDYVLPSDFVDNIVSGTSYISENIKALFKLPRFHKLFYISILLDNNLSNAIKNILVKQNKFYTPEILFVLIYICFTKNNTNNGIYNANLNILYEYISGFIENANSNLLSDNFTINPYYILLHSWCSYVYNKWHHKPINELHKFLDVSNYKITSNIGILGNNYIDLCAKIVGIGKLLKTSDYNLQNDPKLSGYANVFGLITV